MIAEKEMLFVQRGPEDATLPAYPIFVVHGHLQHEECGWSATTGYATALT